MPTNEKLAFTVREAAMLCSLGKDSIYAAIAEGRLPAKKAGRKTLIPRDGLVCFINELPNLILKAKASACSGAVDEHC